MRSTAWSPTGTRCSRATAATGSRCTSSRAQGDVALVSRHFADFGDIKEDPFTGSATGGMAAYCARYGIVSERVYGVEQGMHVHRPGRGQVEVGGDPPHDIGRITVAGPAVTVMHATMTL